MNKLKDIDLKTPIPFICRNHPEKTIVENLTAEELDDLTLKDLLDKMKERFENTEYDFKFISKLHGCSIAKKLNLPVSYFTDLLPFYFDIYGENDVPNIFENEAFAAGGGAKMFCDVTKGNALKKLEFSSSAPKWRICDKGLNVFGKCETKGCEAYGYEIICPLGYGFFDLFEESDQVKCPMCKKNVEPNTCGFLDCKYYFQGIKLKKDRTKEKVKTDERINEGKNLDYYSPEEAGTAQWQKFKIFIKDRKKKDTTATGENCSVCDEKIDNPSDKDSFSCKHACHKNCHKKIIEQKIVKTTYECHVCKVYER